VPFAALAASPAAAQTIEQRAAQVRQQLETPPPVETVIDRGTREIGRPAPPAQSAASPSGRTDSRPVEGVQTPPEFVERLNRLLGVSGAQIDHTTPRGSSFADVAPGAALRTAPQGPAAVGMKDFPPGVLVIHRPGDGHVGGTSNLSTGVPPPGTAP
jgi:hypothetical protein